MNTRLLLIIILIGLAVLAMSCVPTANQNSVTTIPSDSLSDTSQSTTPNQTATTVVKSSTAASSAASTQVVPSTTNLTQSNLVLLPGGEFEMGDHIGVIDPKQNLKWVTI